jgi:hypothetical protein
MTPAWGSLRASRTSGGRRTFSLSGSDLGEALIAGSALGKSAGNNDDAKPVGPPLLVEAAFALL